MFKWEEHDLEELRKDYLRIGSMRFAKKYHTSRVSIYKYLGHLTEEQQKEVKRLGTIEGVKRRKAKGNYNAPRGYIRNSKFKDALRADREALLKEFHSMNVVQFTKKWGISSETAYTYLGNKRNQEIPVYRKKEVKESNYWDGIGESVSYGPMKSIIFGKQY